MAKAELKTKVNDASVTKFINSVAEEQKRNDCFEILKLMKRVTKEEPKMWVRALLALAVITTREIGRASCRERV